ncbi:MAG: C40 family peptidase [Cyanobacteria bacterium P01_A01_bin.135]
MPSPNQTCYACQVPLNLYSTPELGELATQAAAGRQLRILSPPAALEVRGNREAESVQVLLWEDDYPGWIKVEDLKTLRPKPVPASPLGLTRAQISDRLPDVIAFAEAAMAQPNIYLWGGTLGPNYDCSGLVQAAFASVGVWLPRDSYQQEAFTEPVSWDAVQRGDLIFFGGDRTTHVALALDRERYIHSSGKDQGRNGIGVDVLSEAGDTVSQAYFRQRRRAGRVMQSYRATGEPFQC